MNIKKYSNKLKFPQMTNLAIKILIMTHYFLLLLACGGTYEKIMIIIFAMLENSSTFT